MHREPLPWPFALRQEAHWSRKSLCGSLRGSPGDSPLSFLDATPIHRFNPRCLPANLVQHLLPEPDDESPPIPPAIGLREQWETTRRHLSADQLRLISQSFSTFRPSCPAEAGSVRSQDSKDHDESV